MANISAIVILLIGSPITIANSHKEAAENLSQKRSFHQEIRSCDGGVAKQNEILVCGEITDQELYRYKKLEPGPEPTIDNRIVINLLENVSVSPDLEQTTDANGVPSKRVMVKVKIKF